MEREQWDSDSFEWIKVLKNMRGMGFKINFPVEVYLYFNNHTDSINFEALPGVSISEISLFANYNNYF